MKRPQYRVTYISGHEDNVPQRRKRLSAPIERLGACESPAGPPKEFMVLHGMDDAAQARGYAFERFL
jgi:hypothetical protein